MEIEAPTFNALDKPQRRAFILRDQLRFVDPQHLNEFLSNISNDEPPTYTKINGVIKPSLTLVTLKEEAKRFDLGNVYLPEDDNNVYRVYLVVENRQIQMRAEEPLPLDENILDSCPIHGFIARSMVPLFKEKFHLIHARMNRFNEARRAAYKMLNQAPALFHEGETLLRLHPKAENDSVACNSKRIEKRERNEEVVPHVSNKRSHIGFDTVPEEAKSRTFDKIPNHIKIDLFNSIAKTAFPNFDNLMTAAWNVVSIYSACGSEFPDLHSAIVVLKNVLQDFDEAYGRRGDRTTPSYRYDFGGPSRAGPSTDRDQCGREVRSLPPVSTSAASQGQIGQSSVQTPIKLQDDPEAPMENFARVERDGYHKVEQETEQKVDQEVDQEVEQGVHQKADQEAAPGDLSAPVLQLAEFHQDQIEDDDSSSGDDEIPAANPRLSRTTTSDEDSRPPSPQYIPETRTGGSPLQSAHSSSDGQYTNSQYDSIENTCQDTVETDINVRAKSIPQATTSALVHHEGNVSTVSKTNGHLQLHNANVIRPSLTEQGDVESEHGQFSRSQLQHRPIPTFSVTPTPPPRSIPVPTPIPMPKKQKRVHIREMSIGTLEKKIRERTEHLTNIFGSVENAPDPNKGYLQQLEAARQLKLQEESNEKDEADNDSGQEGSHVAGMRPMSAPTNHGMFGKYRGSSALGGQRPTDIAPVAPMYPNAVMRDPKDAMGRDGRPGGTPPGGLRGRRWGGNDAYNDMI